MLLPFITRFPIPKFKVEKDFQWWLGKQIHDHHGMWWPYHKMSDMSIDKKPCDCFYVDELGRTYFMELKIIDGYTFNINKMESQQVEFLSKLSKMQKRFDDFPELVDYTSSLALLLVYSKKLHEWKCLHWIAVEKELLEHGSIKVFS